MTYRILFERPAEKAFRRLPAEVREALAKRISALAEEPRPAEARKLEGAEDCYRLRQGDYRLIYTIIEERVVVLVLRVGHRGDIYRNTPELAKAIRRLRSRS